MDPLPALHPPHKISHDQYVTLIRTLNILVLPRIDTLGTCGDLVMDDRLAVLADDVNSKLLFRHV